MLRITLVKSPIGYRSDQRQTLEALGLRRMGQTVSHADTPSIRGLTFKVRHLVRVEEQEGGVSPAHR